MNFCIVSVGWRCADLWEQTLRSVETQSVDNWRVAVVYDGGDGEGPAIRDWCAERGGRWTVQLNDQQQYAVRNQCEAIEHLAPEDDDVVVFLDLDGDQLAHPDVLAHLADAYADGTLVTYGQYRPEPAEPPCAPAVPFPPSVVAQGSYRAYVQSPGGCFPPNHLRTISGRVLNAMPSETFRWSDGRYYESGCDYVFMLAALELAGGRYRCMDEILLRYNHANPNADYLVRAAETSACVSDFLNRPPLAPLP